MKILYSKGFTKNFKKRIATQPKLHDKFDSRLKLFVANPQNNLLNDHSLKGSRKQYRSFWIAGDVRVIYEMIDKKTVKFIDIGSHN